MPYSVRTVKLAARAAFSSFAFSRRLSRACFLFQARSCFSSRRRYMTDTSKTGWNTSAERRKYGITFKRGNHHMDDVGDGRTFTKTKLPFWSLIFNLELGSITIDARRIPVILIFEILPPAILPFPHNDKCPQKNAHFVKHIRNIYVRRNNRYWL